MNLTVVSVSVLSLQFQRKSGFVLVDIDLHQREILQHSLKKSMRNEIIDKALCKCKNLIVMGDFNIDIKSSNSDKDKLNFCDLFNLTNLVHLKNCLMKNSKFVIALILTNKLLRLQKRPVVETGLSGYQYMISTFFKVSSSKLRTVVTYYRSCFNELDFLCSLEKANFDFFENDSNRNYNLLIDTFLGIFVKPAPLKKKFVRGNNAPFVNREFQKEIYVRSRLRNKYKYWVNHLRKTK